jgi:hypothetical protein
VCWLTTAVAAVCTICVGVIYGMGAYLRCGQRIWIYAAVVNVVARAVVSMAAMVSTMAAQRLTSAGTVLAPFWFALGLLLLHKPRRGTAWWGRTCCCACAGPSLIIGFWAGIMVCH